MFARALVLQLRDLWNLAGLRTDFTPMMQLHDTTFHPEVRRDSALQREPPTLVFTMDVPGMFAEQAMLTLGVAKLPEVAQDNTDRNRTSPFAFTGSKFEFRAVGASQSIAFPVMLLQAAVAEAIGEIIEQLKAELKTGKSTDDAALKVAAKAFKESAAVRFEGNNYSDEWVVEAKTRGLLNLRRTPEALAQLLTDDAKALFKNTHILTAIELESRYHVRLERYVKDILIELHTIQQMIDTQVLPAAYAYLGSLAASAGQGAAAGALRRIHLHDRRPRLERRPRG